jgi:hypothetical protein
VRESGRKWEGGCEMERDSERDIFGEKNKEIDRYR